MSENDVDIPECDHPDSYEGRHEWEEEFHPTYYDDEYIVKVKCKLCGFRATEKWELYVRRPRRSDD